MYALDLGLPRLVWSPFNVTLTLCCHRTAESNEMAFGQRIGRSGCQSDYLRLGPRRGLQP
jgi:hypothetical protein